MPSGGGEPRTTTIPRPHCCLLRRLGWCTGRQARRWQVCAANGAVLAADGTGQRRGATSSHCRLEAGSLGGAHCPQGWPQAHWGWRGGSPGETAASRTGLFRKLGSRCVLGACLACAWPLRVRARTLGPPARCQAPSWWRQGDEECVCQVRLGRLSLFEKQCRGRGLVMEPTAAGQSQWRGM
jgi:hypothetical protein